MKYLLIIFGDKSAGFHRELSHSNAVEAVSRPPPFFIFSLSKSKPYVFSVYDFCLLQLNI